MTKDEIMALKPGRELDAIVAVHVMGLHEVEEERSYGYGPDDKEKVWRKADGYKWDGIDFSTEIELAWAVFQRLIKSAFTIRESFLRHLADLCDTVIAEREHVTTTVRIRWPSAMQFLCPEFICKAALLTVLDNGIEQENSQLPEDRAKATFQQ